MPITTQSRQVPNSQRIPLVEQRNYVASAAPVVPSWSLYGDLGQYLHGQTQKTTSFRTSSSDAAVPDSLKSLVGQADIYRNGFTEPNRKYDSGHPFFTTKTEFTCSHLRWHSIYTRKEIGRTYEMRGPLLFRIGSTSPFLPTPPPESQLTSAEIGKWGGAAIAATAPTQSTVNLAAFLGEMYSNVPRILGVGLLESKSDMMRALGSEYLNYEFGWKPLVQDLRYIAQNVLNSTRILKQYHRDSGRMVRRKHSFASEVTETESVSSAGANGNLHWSADGTTKLQDNRPLEITHRVRKDRWFSGAYTYYLPTDDSFIGKMETYASEADRLLGIELTPAVLWELAPWSWLVDWVADIGSMLTSASLLSSDGLVLRYGYLMQKTEYSKIYKIQGGSNITFLNGGIARNVTNTYRRETKERVQATPFGFGLSLTGFTTRQWAILGALGMTKAPKSLLN